MNDALVRSMENLFLALGDKTRLRLLGLMANGPVAVGDLVDAIGESQPKVSRHLAYLRNASVVSTRRDGKWIYYEIQDPKEEEVQLILNGVIHVLAGEGARAAKPSASATKRNRRNETKDRPERQVDAYDDSQTSDILDTDVPDANDVYEENEFIYEEEEMDVFLL